jgi:phage tail-like protein
MVDQVFSLTIAMALQLPPPPPQRLSHDSGPPLNHRFGVYFYLAGTRLNSMDIRFQRVSGLQARISTKEDSSIASKLCRKLIPTGIEYGELELYRGLVANSKLAKEVEEAFNEFRFNRYDVLVTVYSEFAEPISSFIFSEAYPIAWELDTLDAQSDPVGSVLIEKLSLTYTRARSLDL